jgi:hypothetical protein
VAERILAHREAVVLLKQLATWQIVHDWLRDRLED